MQDSSDQLGFIDARAAALGLTLDGKGAKRHVVEVERRPGPMELGERYLSDAEAFGVTTAAFRTKNAFTHGLEIGLLAATVAVPSSYDAQLMQPQQMAVGELAFATMSVPLAVFNATRAMARRFDRIRDGDPAWTRVLRVRDNLVEAWAAPISADLDEIAPNRPRTGLFGPLEA